MGKLFNLKEWLTVADAAGHLSIIFGEKVAEADVLRLVLDGRLKLSIYFVNAVEAKRAYATRLNSPLVVTNRGTAIGKEQPYSLVLGLAYNECELNTLDDEIVFLEGVYDLVMLGEERLEVDRRFQSLVGGPDVWDPFPYGPFVSNRDGQMFQLQKAWQECNESGKTIGFTYCAAPALPFNDAYLIVRTEALREFEASINAASAIADKSITTTERNTLLTIIAALCDTSNIEHQGRGAANHIAGLIVDIGSSVSEETILKVLRKIPNALEARMK